MGHITVNKRISLVIFVYHVKCFAIPDAKLGSFAIFDIFAKNTLHFVEFCLQVDHLLGCGVDLLQCILLLASEIFLQNLEEQLGNQGFHMVFIGRLQVDALSIHPSHVVLVFGAKIVQTSHKVVTLVCQLTRLLIQRNLVLSILYFILSEVVELGIQITQTSLSRLMVHLEALQVVSLADQVRVDLVCLSLNLRAQTFLHAQFFNQRVLLLFKSIELISELPI